MPVNPRISRAQEPRDAIRERLDRQRLILQVRPPSSDRPVDGELILSPDAELLLYTGGKYRRLYPPEDTVSDTPQWVRDGWTLREAELKAAGIPEEEWQDYA